MAINLLDADTAYFRDSIGQMTDVLRLVNPPVRTATPNGMSPFFGAYALEIETNTANTLSYVGTPVEAFPVNPSTEHTFSYSMMSPIAGRETNISIVEYDSGGSQVANPFNSAEALTEDDWGRHSMTWTTDASAATIRFQIRYRIGAGFSSGEKAWIDGICLLEGTSSTFVPPGKSRFAFLGVP